MKINEDFLPLVISPTEPIRNARKRVWKQYKSELLINSNSTETLNGLTIVRSTDGTITINGTASANSFIAIRRSPNKYKFNLDCNYILKGCPSGGDYTNLYSLYIDIDERTKIKDEGNGGFFTQNGRYGEIYIVIRSGYTANNLTFTPQLIANGKEYILNDNNVYEEFNSQNEIYSTDEVRIGTWIDGKPLYRRIYDFALPSCKTSGTGVIESHTINNAKFSFIEFGYIYANFITAPMPYFTKQNPSYNIGYDLTTPTNLRIWNSFKDWNSARILVSILYTKTTD